MKRLLPLCLLAACALAQASVTLTVVETDPPAPATLNHWEQFYVLANYRTDRTIRVRGDAYYRGKSVTSMTGGSPAYRVGEGEAMFWFAWTEPARVDKIVIRAEDDATRKTLTQVELPVDLVWTGVRAGSTRARPEWVPRLRAEHERIAKAEYRAYMDQPTPWWQSVLFMVAMWSIPLYFVVQVIALRRLRGGWRVAAALPAIPMLFILGHAIFAFFAGSNLFPLGLIFTCAPALVYLLFILAISPRLTRAAAR